MAPNAFPTAFLYGAVSGLALVLGAGTALRFRLRQRATARMMAFGSGILICALTLGLLEEAFHYGGAAAVTIGFLAGGLAFIGGDYLIHRAGGRQHRRKPWLKNERCASGQAILLGAFLDGLPESAALGITIFSGQGRGPLMLAAIFLSNFPEALASVAGLRRTGFRPARILKLWGLAGISTLAVTLLSFLFLPGLPVRWLGLIEAFAAGAILAMLANSMMPEAYEEGGLSIGIMTVLGCLVAFLLARF
ncbi:MAG TPA: ZIP family zinc transporter [bacterium]|uniref:ZIP Zinc transporter n=1 Tax=candidate division TA06 bacterium ADurb.Bin417 TaxID=1852828 RepID=A0A1V5MCN0_UNCT6|nr:MAG: ZIP Zinc transporter [candidate division TA06 bacterium ADurb.Bin417]HNQ34760.1 ZIP family zinc transporter [bacterium]HNS48476.1 ZIP family zinc transporter [bacterium]